ncbi:hypothetical protein BGP77_05995 [Saccharospirillum sp. MSK14-1]|uniref:DUF4256 domain-containing protein n=1 Tax=Saccharospirillum sp. MSK14-1 TaxID=1897632 RepID=UPI000D33C790|nr:DUF4256 domain-containing protein [Saccharospirillum sp. MSK14-1]PTY36836.1 hypothetical protein BGP77_05995 [Saccharospirillum sp. MSK14-1]
MALENEQQLMATLKQRFADHPERHSGIDWQDVVTRLLANPSKLSILEQMEQTGGEPDVIAYDDSVDGFIFCDCSTESPTGRRSLCYDDTALQARKKNKPAGSVVDHAVAMGIELLSEADYRYLQSLGDFDLKTSSWVVTPDSVRQRGGALFGDRRYGQVFIYHNGADSYYAARGFRGRLTV